MAFRLSRLEPRKLLALTSVLGGLAISANAWAVPSFSRQTGWSCATCHTSYPQLTPMGRIFKLMGYTTTNLQPQQKVEAKVGNVVHLLLPRISQLSIFVQAADTHVAGGQAVLGRPSRASGGPVGGNNNLQVPKQVSLFYAGEITPHVGDFLHITYSGNSGGFSFDDSSIVRAQAWSLGHYDTLITGVDVNNTPSATDLWNTSTDWQAPFFSSNYTAAGEVPTTFIAASQGASFPLIGLGAYAADIVGPNRANWFYAEADAYNNSQGTGNAPNGGIFSENGGNQMGAFGQLAGTAPYLRLAYQHDWSDWNWEVGTYDMWSRVYANPTSSAVDRFYDYDLDSQLQWLDINDNDNVTVRANLIHEDANFAASDVGVGSSDSHGQLNTFNLNATYWYHDEYGAQGGFQDVTGTANSSFWGGNVYTSANGSPNTTDEWVEASYLPWWNTRLSVRYTVFNKFRGLTGNNGVSPSKFNTIELLAWIAY
ncbi:cytochrome C [Acidiferrobacter thiooxydans]|uniref:Cytochrome C n=1 Tax=Acidiferrobacter thiooxydans TaxID=163359 RepID=A0A368HKE6_9GAMM|nr:cytochrome C [Acidiferrobacter thiooxydans]RCN58617.1 cytochrome C [Acidiferrobacter thiooxydans]